MAMPTLRQLAPLPAAASAAYGTALALQYAGVAVRPAHAVGAVALFAYLAILTALISAITPVHAPARD